MKIISIGIILLIIGAALLTTYLFLAAYTTHRYALMLGVLITGAALLCLGPVLIIDSLPFMNPGAASGSGESDDYKSPYGEPEKDVE